MRYAQVSNGLGLFCLPLALLLVKTASFYQTKNDHYQEKIEFRLRPWAYLHCKFNSYFYVRFCVAATDLKLDSSTNTNNLLVATFFVILLFICF